VRGFKKAMSEGEEEGNKQLSGPAEKDADFDSTPPKTGEKSSRV
jgi:hypothetical protein